RRLPQADAVTAERLEEARQSWRTGRQVSRRGEEAGTRRAAERRRDKQSLKLVSRECGASHPAIPRGRLRAQRVRRDSIYLQQPVSTITASTSRGSQPARV